MKLVFDFCKRVKTSQNCVVQAICGTDVWWKSSIRANWNKLLLCPQLWPGYRPLSRRLDRCDRVIQNESSDSNGGSNMTCLFSAATCTLSHTTCHLYVDVALFYYDVTHNYVLWTEGVSEINY